MRPLLPPSTGQSAVVITTRNDLSVLDGWSCLTLRPFEANSGDARELFARHLDRAWAESSRRKPERHRRSGRRIAAGAGDHRRSARFRHRRPE